MNNDIKLVIFDLDGTLIDAYKAVASSMNYTLAQMNCAPVDDETIKRRVGWGDRHLIGAFVPEPNIDRALSIFRQHHARALKGGTTFLPGARKLLDYLKAKHYTLAVASNRPARFTHIILKHLQIQHVFDYVLCGDQVAHPKPAADILEQILKKFSFKAKEALYVGDMTVDAETGHKAGIRTIVVLTGSSTSEEAARLKPFKIIGNVYEVAQIIEDMMC
jgi:phosphoglycolate phosphatase